MATVEVKCRGTYTDRQTGETLHKHDPAVCEAFTVDVVTMGKRRFVIVLGNQYLDGADHPLPDDFEELDRLAQQGGTARGRLAINCPEPGCGRGLTCASGGVLRAIKALAEHGVPDVDIESLRGYGKS